MKKLLKVTIGIVAYNEAENIGKLLRSIRLQRHLNYKLERIIVVLDGCTDTTFKQAKENSFLKVQIINHKKRTGKSQRLNEIFESVKSDIIVLLDADVVLADKYVISKLVDHFFNDSNLGLVGGNPQPIKARTFIEDCVNTSFYGYAPLRYRIRNSSNPYGCDGRILALRKEFAHEVNIPSDMIANDAYLYFTCIKEGFKFKHSSKAIVLFRSPTTLKDQIRQNKRFIAARYRLIKIFGNLLVKSEYKIPRLFMFKLFLKQFIKKPVQCLTIYALNKYIHFLAKKEENKMNALWQMAITTKVLISQNEN